MNEFRRAENYVFEIQMEGVLPVCDIGKVGQVVVGKDALDDDQAGGKRQVRLLAFYWAFNIYLLNSAVAQVPASKIV